MGDAYDDLEAAQCRDCMKLREQVETLTKNAMNRPKDCPSCNTWADNVALRAWVGRLTTERDDWYENSKQLLTKLAAANAREAKLRDALSRIASDVKNTLNYTYIAREALALPADDSALMERLKEERECVYVEMFNQGYINKQSLQQLQGA